MQEQRYLAHERAKAILRYPASKNQLDEQVYYNKANSNAYLHIVRPAICLLLDMIWKNLQSAPDDCD